MSKNGKGNKLVQTWKPIHEQVVIMYVSGCSYAEISEATGFSETWIGTILKSEIGRERREELARRVSERIVESVEDRMVNLARKAMHNIEATINADVPLAALKVKKHQDSVSIKLLESIGAFGKNGSLGGTGSRQPLMSKAGEERLLEAMKEADKARAQGSDIVDVEYEIEDG